MVLNTVSLSTGRYKGSQQVEEMVSVIINDAKQISMEYLQVTLASPYYHQFPSLSPTHTL